MELRNRLANESAATAQAARQSTDQILAILHGSSYAGLESAAQRLSPTSRFRRRERMYQALPKPPPASDLGVGPTTRFAATLGIS